MPPLKAWRLVQAVGIWETVPWVKGECKKPSNYKVKDEFSGKRAWEKRKGYKFWERPKGESCRLLPPRSGGVRSPRRRSSCGHGDERQVSTSSMVQTAAAVRRRCLLLGGCPQRARQLVFQKTHHSIEPTVPT